MIGQLMQEIAGAAIKAIPCIISLDTRSIESYDDLVVYVYVHVYMLLLVRVS